MKKIPTILPKDSNDLSRVIPGEVINGIESFRLKIDGTSCMVLDGNPYCRFDVKLFKMKKGKKIIFSKEEIQSKISQGAIACQEPDEKSGHWPHWVPVLLDNPEHQYIYEGFRNLVSMTHLSGGGVKDGTYECVGPKIQGNPHHCSSHRWIYHNHDELIVKIEEDWKNDAYDFFKKFLENYPWEGLVAYDQNNKPIGKIRRSDFGYKKVRYSAMFGVINFFPDLSI